MWYLLILLCVLFYLGWYFHHRNRPFLAPEWKSLVNSDGRIEFDLKLCTNDHPKRDCCTIFQVTFYDSRVHPLRFYIRYLNKGKQGPFALNEESRMSRWTDMTAAHRTLDEAWTAFLLRLVNDSRSIVHTYSRSSLNQEEVSKFLVQS